MDAILSLRVQVMRSIFLFTGRYRCGWLASLCASCHDLRWRSRHGPAVAVVAGSRGGTTAALDARVGAPGHAGRVAAARAPRELADVEVPVASVLRHYGYFFSFL